MKFSGVRAYLLYCTIHPANTFFPNRKPFEHHVFRRQWRWLWVLLARIDFVSTSKIRAQCLIFKTRRGVYSERLQHVAKCVSIPRGAIWTEFGFFLFEIFSEFLRETTPYFRDPKTAILQTPQFFRYRENQTWVEKGAGVTQELFYRMVQVNFDDDIGVGDVGPGCALQRTAEHYATCAVLLAHNKLLVLMSSMVMSAKRGGFTWSRPKTATFWGKEISYGDGLTRHQKSP